MANPEHVEVVKQGVETIRKWREENPDTVLDLCGVNLDLINLRGANLAGARLTKASLARATLAQANLVGARLEEGLISPRPNYLQGAILPMAKLIGADLLGTKLGGAHLPEANLAGAFLVKADLTGADLSGADLFRATLSKANLAAANLFMANLARAHFRWANLFRTQLHGVWGAHHARGLETVRFTPPTSTHTPSPINDASERDAREFDTCRRPWPERRLDWEFLRKWGCLPLFGISYTALILIPIVLYGLALYNNQIEQVHTWADQIGAQPDSPMHQFASLLKRLDRPPDFPPILPAACVNHTAGGRFNALHGLLPLAHQGVQPRVVLHR